MQRAGKERSFELKTIVDGELQLQAQEVAPDIAADLFDELERMVIAAEQDMLAVVELGVVMPHAARASAELFGALKYRDGDVLRSQRDGSSHAGIATADDGNIMFLIPVHRVMASGFAFSPFPFQGEG